MTVTVTREKWTKGSPHPRPMRKWCVPPKKKGTKEVDEPMEEGEQGGEAKPTEDVTEKPATPTETSLAVAER